LKTAGSFEPNHEVLLEVEGFVKRSKRCRVITIGRFGSTN
jgi:hypothetical protein